MISLIVFSIIGVVGLVCFFLAFLKDDPDCLGILSLICAVTTVIGFAFTCGIANVVYVFLFGAAICFGCFFSDLSGLGIIFGPFFAIAGVIILIYNCSAPVKNINTNFEIASETKLVQLWDEDSGEDAKIYVEKISDCYYYKTIDAEKNELDYEKIYGDVRFEESDDCTKPVLKVFEKEEKTLRENRFTGKIFEKTSGKETYYLFEIPTGSCKN